MSWLGKSLDLISEMVMITESGPHDGGESRIVFVNQAFVKHTGYAVDELVGHSPRVLHGPHTDPDAVARIRHALRLRQAVRLDMIYHTRDGRPYCADVEAVPITDGEGQVTHFLSLHRDITDRVEIDSALRDSEERFRGLVELSSDWYWEMDEHLRFRRFDGHEVHRFVHSRSLGAHPWELPSLNMDEAAWAAHRADLLAHKPFRSLEVHRINPGGGSDWIAASGEPMFDAGGRFRGYRGVGSYINDRKRTEEALQQINELLRVALENVPYGVIKVDADSRVSLYNQRALGLLDLPESLMSQRPASQEVQAYQRARGDLSELDEATQAIASRWPEHGQADVGTHVYTRRTRDGRVLEISTRNLEGGGWVRTYLDLTEHLQAQQALRESEARFRSLTELSSDWYWEQDEDLRYVRLEGRSILPVKDNERYLGIRPWDVPALNMTEADWQRHRDDLAARKPFHRLELKRLDAQGDALWVSLSGMPFFDEQGRFKGYRGVGRNITARKQAEQHTLDRLAFSQRLTHNVPGMVYQMSRRADGKFFFTFVSAAVSELFEIEVPNQELPGWQFLERIHPEDREAVTSSLRSSVESLAEWRVDYRVLLPKGGVRWHHTASRPEHQSDGSVVWYGFTSDVTDRMQMDVQLREANQLLAARTDMLQVTLSHLSQGVVMFDPEGRVMYHNQRAVAMLDLPESLLAMHPTLDQVVQYQFDRNVFPGRTREEVARAYGRVVEGGKLVAPAQYLRQDNNGRVLEVKTSLMPSGGWVRTYADVTDYMDAQRRLHDSEERLRLMLLGSNDGAWDWNLETGECYFSPRWWEMLGLAPNERPSRNALWSELIHPHDLLRVNAEIDSALQEQHHSFELEFRMQHADGRVLTVLDRGFIVRDENQRAVRVAGTLSDISARKQLELRLEQSEASLSALFESIPDGVWFKDLAGRYVLCNPGRARLYGRRVQEMLGRTEAELLPAAETAADLDTDRRAQSSHAPVVFESGMLIDGDHRTFEVVKRAVFDNGGQIMGVLGVARDITERKRAEAQIERLAFYDPLTQLCNRRLFQDRLEQAQATSSRSGQWGAVLFIDLDNFKDLNDTLGHDMGDELLRQVAQRLQLMVREEDTVARLGGDEFVVLFEQLGVEPEAAALNANALGLKLLDTLNQPYELSAIVHHKTPSIGLTLFRDHDERIEDILQRADLAMYQAKAAGRNTMRFYDPNMQAVVSARAALERDLRAAVSHGQLLLYFQPVVDAARQVRGYEALVRWRHPQRGMVSPGEFIPVAELTGLIGPIGHWVLQAACEQLVRWSAQPETAHWTLAVNLSARQLRHPDFVPEVLAVLANTGARADRLKLELTESLLLHDVEETIVKMGQLAERGIQFALDDFGTGYSSLSYLKRLPLNQLKIDQSFVRDLLTDPNDAAIARTILQLAQSLDLDVVAEGVETDGQHQFLQLMGCKAFQGYLFGRPGPLE